MAVKRAYDADAKEARRQAILEAADKLFLKAEQLPSVDRIAQAAGLAKGTVYLYFRTKEEIFAFLLLEGWKRVIDTANFALEAKEPPSTAAASFIGAFAGALRGEGTLLQLDALGKGVLEQNMTPAALRIYNSQFHDRLASAGTLLETRLGLSDGRGVKLLIRTHALTRGMWQAYRTPHGESGEVFQKELEEALTEYWRGALQPSGG